MPYCHNCERYYHYLGIARHRRAHLDRGEFVKITYTNGDTWLHRPLVPPHTTRGQTP